MDAVLADCDVVIDETYHTLANQQAMMETFRTECFIDTYGRLNVVSSTQIIFHVRRILSNALGIPKSKIRVSKPRIGGGFGAKQTVVAEIFPAFVTWKTGKPSRMIFSREESQPASSPRHEMEIHVRLGADRNGKIRAVDLHTLSNTGAYGEHGPTTVGLSGHKSIPLYGSCLLYTSTVTGSQIAVIPGALIFIGNQKGDGGSGGFSLKDTGQDLYGIGFSAGRCKAALPRFPAIQKDLDIFLTERKSGGAAIDHRPHSPAVGFPPGGYCKIFAKS